MSFEKLKFTIENIGILILTVDFILFFFRVPFICRWEPAPDTESNLEHGAITTTGPAGRSLRESRSGPPSVSTRKRRHKVRFAHVMTETGRTYSATPQMVTTWNKLIHTR